MKPSRPRALVRALIAAGLLLMACGGPDEDEAAAVANGRVACSERIVGGDQSRIISFAADGSDSRTLTTPAYDIMPTWSRDGERILFASNRSGAMEIWAMRADGGDLRQITFDTPGGNFTPVESPDGTRIAFSSAREGAGHPEVWVMNPDGSEQRRLTVTPELPAQELVWSLHPPGRRTGSESPMPRRAAGAHRSGS